MTNPEVTSIALPIIDVTGNIVSHAEAAVLQEPSSGMSLRAIDETVKGLENLDVDNNITSSTISIVNSSDVIIGSVTQFHGPVTIVQHLQQEQHKCAIDNEDDKANMDYAALPSKVQSSSSPSSVSACLPKRLLVCFAALAVISVVVIVSVIFTVELPATQLDIDTTDDPNDDNSNNDDDDNGFSNVTGTNKYNISDHQFYTIKNWGGRQPLYTVNVTQPIHFVIISHSAGTKCTTFAGCSAQMRNMQDLHVSNNSPNIGYNFAIGGDGDIYEGRGWYTRNFHRDSTIGVCFIGNYVYDELTVWMVDALTKLLESGLTSGALPKNYQIIAHNQTYATLSPGQNVYKVIKHFSNFYSGLLPSTKV